MTPNRTIRRLAAGALVLLLAASAVGQEFDLAGLQPFAPANLSPYGGQQRPHEGFFFSFDEVYWNIQRADTAIIGASEGRLVATFTTQYALAYPGFTPWWGVNREIQNTSLDTGPLGNATQWGERIEFGRVYDHNGWMFSLFRIRRFDQQFVASNASMTFIDPNIYFDPSGDAGDPLRPDGFNGMMGFHGLLYGEVGRRLGVTSVTPPSTITTGVFDVYDNLPVIFSSVTVSNTIDTWGLELDYIRRTHPLHNGAYLEWFLGGRYLQFDETFDVQTATFTGTPTQLVNVLGGTRMITETDNHIVGPQIGVRIVKQTGRFTFSTEGRGVAGFNSQSFHQSGRFVTILPQNNIDATNVIIIGQTSGWQGNAINNTMNINEFSPIVELRAEVRCALTRSMTLRAGWSGIWMDGIARASNVIRYQVPSLGFEPTRNRQDVLMHGLTVGVDINR
jgi:hypothetical protein